MHSKEFLALLSQYVGSFSGTGLNHEGQKFKGELNLQPVVDGKGFELNFVATGEKSEVFHKETSIIAPSLEEKLAVWNFNSNTPGLTAHELTLLENRGDFTLARFCFGDLNDSSQFREQLDLELFENGDAKYTYSWGLPSGEFKERSGVKMSPVSGNQNVTNNYFNQVIDEFKSTWAYTRKMTTEFINQVPEDKWTFSHHSKFAPLHNQFKHMVGVYGCYIDALKSKKMDLSKKKTFSSGLSDRESILSALKKMDKDIFRVLDDLRTSDLKTFKVNFFWSGNGVR